VLNIRGSDFLAKYRDALPQLGGDWFLTDGGIETTLVFNKGIDLPEFASFPLLDDEACRQMLRDCVRPYFELARKHGVGMINETPTWRTNASALSHAELDEATEIDEGDPAELGEQHRELLETLTKVNILGGCCGTDHRHVDAIFQACRSC
jgi:homocysteine S-methyltransferase